MIYALSPNWIVRILCILIVAFMAAMRPIAEWGEYWSARGIVIGAVNLVVFLLTFRPVFHFLYRTTRASKWMFPMLDGHWEGEARSNWARVSRMAQAARTAGDCFDILHEDLSPDALTAPVPVIATIKAGVFEFSIEVRVVGEDRVSRTIFVRPEWCKPYPARISYIYRQFSRGHVQVSDAREHLGSAVLEYDADSDCLEGSYWTNRQAELGLTTAGVISLRRVVAPVAASTVTPAKSHAN